MDRLLGALESYLKHRSRLWRPSVGHGQLQHQRQHQLALAASPSTSAKGSTLKREILKGETPLWAPTSRHKAQSPSRAFSNPSVSVGGEVTLPILSRQRLETHNGRGLRASQLAHLPNTYRQSAWSSQRLASGACLSAVINQSCQSGSHPASYRLTESLSTSTFHCQHCNLYHPRSSNAVFSAFLYPCISATLSTSGRGRSTTKAQGACI